MFARDGDPQATNLFDMEAAWFGARGGHATLAVKQVRARAQVLPRRSHAL